MFWVPNIGDTATHTCREITTCWAENNSSTSRHIFTAMVTNSFNNSYCTTISNAKSFTNASSYVNFTRSCTIKYCIPCYDISFRRVIYLNRRDNNYMPTRKAFT